MYNDYMYGDEEMYMYGDEEMYAYDTTGYYDDEGYYTYDEEMYEDSMMAGNSAFRAAAGFVSMAAAVVSMY